jgi:rRNA-processing protein EBP2
MGKKFIQHKHIEEEEELSDLEIDAEVEEPVVQVNEIERLETLTKNINSEFVKQFSSKGKNPSWLETLLVINPENMDQTLNVDDDIKRELLFYNATHSNTIQALRKLKDHGEKINRPDDFFAEMIKSDNQMDKIKYKFISEQVRIKKFEQKKQKMQNIKFAKAVKSFNLDERLSK